MAQIGEREKLLIFQHTDGIGSVTMRKIYDYFTSFSIAAEATDEELRAAGVRSNSLGTLRENLRNSEQFIQKIKVNIAKYGVDIITFDEEDYPQLLLETYDFPFALYIKGNRKILNASSISVVGTREPSYYGKWTAGELGKYLAIHGVPVVSGLARGIDKHVHDGALVNKGKCIAVVATGLDQVYPPNHAYLYERIIENHGCIISEYPLGTGPHKGHFPARNRIISGISLATIVVESKARGGALITADQALEQNREVFAIPGNINSPNSAGTNHLIKQGAKLISRWDDIFEELQEFTHLLAKDDSSTNQPGQESLAISDDEKKMLAIIPFEEIHIDEISDLYQDDNMHTILIQLQMKKIIIALAGQHYARLK